jgi:hypothetical protein
VQHLQALAVFQRPAAAGRCALPAGPLRGLAALEEHALAGAVGIDLFAAGRVSTVRERAMRGRAAAMMASHSSR